MSNELAIPHSGDLLRGHDGRLEEIERRVLTLGDEPPEEGGCCVVLCCNDSPAEDLEVGQTGTYCSVSLEETPGDAIRLAVNATVTIQAVDAGQVLLDAAVSVNGTVYLERSDLVLTMAAGDKIPISVTNVIDVNDPDPAVAIVVRNLNTPTIRIVKLNLQVLVYGVRDGSTACGEVAGT